KVSLLDAAHEVALRRALPDGVRLYTGDDFIYPELIVGDAHGHSDALPRNAVGKIDKKALRAISAAA
ncbi:DUF993 family protein, partial [Nocardia farcinica]|uniref:DUF993 family protein n=1 Tax=Nocardia farcinica TaxID=37329 RepID=UPI0024559948